MVLQKKTLAEPFKMFLRNIEGYLTNKIENPSLTHEKYLSLSFPNQTTKISTINLGEINDDGVYSNINEIRQVFVQQELLNYQKILTKYFLNDDDLSKKLSLKDIKEMSNMLLDGLTCYPFNKLFTQAFDEMWNKKTQMFEKLNRQGEFRKTGLTKGSLRFRPPGDIEEVTQLLLAKTYNVLESKFSSTLEKYESLALFHLNFEFIHPFAEGNGRLGRFLTMFLSLSFNLIPPTFGSELLDNIDGETYYYQINKVLSPKMKAEDWNLIKKPPASFLHYYLSAVKTTIAYGRKWEETNPTSDWSDFYFMNLNHEEKNFLVKQINVVLQESSKGVV
ncbi:Fic/DOC family protein [Entomoplasma freundtii]|uniref:Uncharacterized protein n=1 Tax=Entomoplasma freundtii TaxID=74700 RepID=A0A2K8NTU2_9MOLU|nr:Fic family protein [Entomoplasma freundtii]ATZ16043.1 hypothetical protein EFREU_v1c00160 [Entomoplasma freundtii]TDY58088.1 Fic/DOC family protein [Entomoplasma freundtii]